MAVSTSIKGNKETSEHKDALILKDIFDDYFFQSSVTGRVLILNNVTLFGEETKDFDLIVLGQLNNCDVGLNCKLKSNSEKHTERSYKKRDVQIHNFCFVIETKKHTIDNIRLEGTTLQVRYKNTYSDVTTQSENQKYALKNFMENRIGSSPYICNFVWLRNVNKENLRDLMGTDSNISNYLPNSFSLKYLLQLALVQRAPYSFFNEKKNTLSPAKFDCYTKNNKININDIDITLSIFESIKQTTGKLTKEKIKRITTPLLKMQDYAQSIGNKLVIISGKAGTGKTMKLLNIACDLAVKKELRLLVLTYNNALVGEIRRLLTLADIPNFPDSYAVDISTIHKYIYAILKGFDYNEEVYSDSGELLARYVPNFITNYYEYLNDLNKRLNDEYKNYNIEALQSLMVCNQNSIAWDFILIDESQDWDPLERDLLFRIYGKIRL